MKKAVITVICVIIIVLGVVLAILFSGKKEDDFYHYNDTENQSTLMNIVKPADPNAVIDTSEAPTYPEFIYH